MKRSAIHMSLGIQVAKRIRELRKSKRLSQEQLAIRADMEATVLSRIERGLSPNIQINTLERIISALEVTPSTFFHFTDDNSPTSQLVAKLSIIEQPEKTVLLLNQLLDWKMK